MENNYLNMLLDNEETEGNEFSKMMGAEPAENEIPKIEEEQPPSGVYKDYYRKSEAVGKFSVEDLNELEKRQRIINTVKNQNIARNLIIGSSALFAFLCIAAVILKALKYDFANDIFEKSFTVLQYSFFTFLGFLFGERNSESK